MNLFDIIEKTDYMLLMFVRDNLSSLVCDRLFVYISRAGNSAFLWMVSAVIFLFFKKTRPAAFLTVIVFVFELIFFEVILKNALARPRPFVEYGLNIIIPPPPTFSFPSGHALSSFSSAVIFYHFIGRKALPFILMALLISFSRIYLLVHYPSDVAAGALFGILTAYGAVRIYEHLVISSGKKPQTD
ncbi:MAG TPA: phosphatase PAP2 family protein [Spirochaetota bacterium]|nr:phosphatase PAP2 family protein [Spirochaetota bacterium]